MGLWSGNLPRPASDSMPRWHGFRGPRKVRSRGSRLRAQNHGAACLAAGANPPSARRPSISQTRTGAVLSFTDAFAASTPRSRQKSKQVCLCRGRVCAGRSRHVNFARGLYAQNVSAPLPPVSFSSQEPPQRVGVPRCASSAAILTACAPTLDSSADGSPRPASGCPVQARTAWRDAGCGPPQ